MSSAPFFATGSSRHPADRTEEFLWWSLCESWASGPVPAWLADSGPRYRPVRSWEWDRPKIKIVFLNQKDSTYQWNTLTFGKNSDFEKGSARINWSIFIFRKITMVPTRIKTLGPQQFPVFPIWYQRPSLLEFTRNLSLHCTPAFVKMSKILYFYAKPNVIGGKPV